MRRTAALALAAALVLVPTAPALADASAPAAKAAHRSHAAKAAHRSHATKAAEAAAPLDPALAKDIRHLLEVSGTPALAVQVTHQMVETFQKMMPNVPAAFWAKFEKKVNPQDFVNLMVPVYAHHLTRSEVKGLIRFYSSPVGRRLVKAMPAITAESQAAGRRFGMKISQEAIDELKAQGYHR